jgi:hypothetical protein
VGVNCWARWSGAELTDAAGRRVGGGGAAAQRYPGGGGGSQWLAAVEAVPAARGG